MKTTWKILVTVGSLILVLAFVTACNFPTFGGAGGPGEGETTTITGNGAEDAAASGPTNNDGAETILIPGATFWMGSEESDALADGDEMPRHQVTLSAFHIYTHEVTNAMYADCVSAGACQPVQPADSGPANHYGEDAYSDNPVVGASWNMANAYCTWAQGRLPTEAEWELAARGKDSLLYPWGSDAPDCLHANSLGCLVPPDTQAVGSFGLGNSPFGLWDMAGSAWEWVQDWYEPDYYTLSPSTDPLGPYYGVMKVVRGGGFRSNPEMLRGASRASGDPRSNYVDVGFRCVAATLSLPETYLAAPAGIAPVPPEAAVGDDPEPMYAIGMAHVSCPYEDGHMVVEFLAESNVPVDYNLLLNGTPFTCTYDEALSLVHCEGPVPADNDTLVSYEIVIEIDPLGMVWLIIPRPLDCADDLPAEWVPVAHASCPEDGWVTLVFTSNIPVFWDSIVLGTDEILSSCWPLGDLETRCSVPERAPGDPYDMHLSGSGEDGHRFIWGSLLVIPDGCAAGDRFIGVGNMCDLDGFPMATVIHEPADPSPESILINGVPPEACIGMAPAVQMCGALPGVPGDIVTVSVCFTGEPCHEETLGVPDCSDPETDTEMSYMLGATCFPPDVGAPVAVLILSSPDDPLASMVVDGETLACEQVSPAYFRCTGLPGVAGDVLPAVFCLAGGACYEDVVGVMPCAGAGISTIIDMGCAPQAVVRFRYTPRDIPLAGGQMDGTDLVCTDIGEGMFTCPVPGAEPGHTVSFTFCLEDGQCFSESNMVPICGVEPGDPPGGDWVIGAIGCHADMSMLDFVIDTGLAWLVPGAGFTYSAGDDAGVYDCWVDGSVAGRLLCSGPRPADPGTLQVCIQQEGGAEVCNFYPDWPDWVAGADSCHIPAAPPCSVYTDASDCTSPAVNCYWHKETGTCSARP